MQPWLKRWREERAGTRKPSRDKRHNRRRTPVPASAGHPRLDVVLGEQTFYTYESRTHRYESRADFLNSLHPGDYGTLYAGTIPYKHVGRHPWPDTSLWEYYVGMDDLCPHCRPKPA